MTEVGSAGVSVGGAFGAGLGLLGNSRTTQQRLMRGLK
jgi:hypothetical protein